MILIADSGSTKTEWSLIHKDNVINTIKTSGINPFYQSPDEIVKCLQAELQPHLTASPDQIYFYGAGCANPEKIALVKEAISRVFVSHKIMVGSDLLGAARSLCQTTPGIACILGTGSNSCYYDGKEIVANVSPLGFILGDEGSGAVMGRKLLGDYFKEVMPLHLREEFAKRYNLTREEALNRVYRSEKPNQFLAQFIPFLSEHGNSVYCQEFVQRNFMEFFERNVSHIPNYTSYPIGFIGSVAYYFSQILNNTASYFGFDKTTIIKDPIDGLEKYYNN